MIYQLFVALFGALIGTFCGAWLLHSFNQKSVKKNRKTAVEALNILRKYDKKSYQQAENQFNTLTISEKRAVVVALHKLGVPFNLAANDVFDIKHIHFVDKMIDGDEIDGMIKQVDHGSCDHLFYLDVEPYFTDNLRLSTARYAAKKYVETVLAHSKVDYSTKTIHFPDNWMRNFSFGEFKTTQVFREQVNDESCFNTQGDAIPERMSSLLNDIDLGLWDSYLMWSYEAYQSVKTQIKINQDIVAQLRMSESAQIASAVDNTQGSNFSPQRLETIK